MMKFQKLQPAMYHSRQILRIIWFFPSSATQIRFLEIDISAYDHTYNLNFRVQVKARGIGKERLECLKMIISIRIFIITNE